MKIPLVPLARTVLRATALFLTGTRLLAATTIDATDAHAYGANIGWINARGDATNGAVVGEFICAGHIYSANCGWINLGNGAPANGIRYGNASATDFGVNTQEYFANGATFEAKLRGFGYGANLGWVNFEATGNPRVDLATGRLLGSAWSANAGWIALSETGVTVRTNAIAPGADTDGDSIPDAWERFQASSLTRMDAATDSDGDGVLDQLEYAADTDPFNAAEFLRITALIAPRNVDGIGPFATDVTWTSQPTRWYEIETNADLLSVWQTAADHIASEGAFTFERFNDGGLVTIPGKRFYRVRAKLPLAP